eukprot:CAMPEP_0113676964 /NCGR_PEP_ID=MMETSP0038_2-20120614/8973_1 /TAXON_ID=2898 /ORGANISM="Cryptomonas paramecium" /LENGTH=183 /DNA_ID=CAMNT_0000594127 /DNA_START=82 /DNA_END=633 /DNA_ORIENTATION=+ /assembly_acc=CAM_ASM_000170
MQSISTFADMLASSHSNHAPANYNGRPGQQRRILTKEQAISIYMQRTIKATRASLVAAKFQVNPKTVRDIWNRRTWAEETQHLWEEGDEPVIRSRRRLLIFGRAQSPSSSSVISAQDTEGMRTRSCSSVSTTCSSPCDYSETYCDNQSSDVGLQEEWEWECGIPPFSDAKDDPFRQCLNMNLE